MRRGAQSLGMGRHCGKSDQATPQVAVRKPSGRVRLCGDFKVTLNPVLKVDHYPLPKAEHLFATLAGRKRFTKLALSEAYRPDSQQCCVIDGSIFST